MVDDKKVVGVVYPFSYGKNGKEDISPAIEAYFKKTGISYSRVKYSITGENFFVFECGDPDPVPDIATNLRVSIGTISRVAKNLEEGIRYVSKQFERSSEFLNSQTNAVVGKTRGAVISGELLVFDTPGVKLDPTSFGFWNNPKDEIYDTL